MTLNRGRHTSSPGWDRLPILLPPLGSNVAQESSSCSLAKPQTCNFGSAQYADSKRGVHGAVGLGASWLLSNIHPTQLRRAQRWSDETPGQDTKFGDPLVSSRCPNCFVQARASLRRDFCARLVIGWIPFVSGQLETPKFSIGVENAPSPAPLGGPDGLTAPRAPGAIMPSV